MENQNIINEEKGNDVNHVLAPVIAGWISIDKQLPEAGFEVLLFNAKWIDEDFNPKGVRIGCRDDLAGWYSAYWCNYHDEYHTRTTDEDDKQFTDFKAENQIPTHWMEIMPCVG